MGSVESDREELKGAHLLVQETLQFDIGGSYKGQCTQSCILRIYVQCTLLNLIYALIILNKGKVPMNKG